MVVTWELIHGDPDALDMLVISFLLLSLEINNDP